jgi:hypothetical protein
VAERTRERPGRSPASVLERTVGIEPTPPYRNSTALSGAAPARTAQYPTRQRLPAHLPCGVFTAGQVAIFQKKFAEFPFYALR